MGAGSRRFKSSRPDHFFDRLTLVVAAALLLLPAAAMVVRDEEEFRKRFRRVEQRPPAHFSVGKLEAWFDDALGFRNELVTLNNALTYAFELPTDKMVVGSGGRLYLGNRHNQIIDQHTGAAVFSEVELKRFLAALEQRQRFLEERGIAFVFAVAPNGHTVYPEHLPAWVRNRRGVTRLSQLERTLRRRGIVYADLRAALADARRTTDLPVYYKTDSHWNSVGAWAAYRQIMRELAPQLPALRPLEEMAFERLGDDDTLLEKIPGVPLPDDIFGYKLTGAVRPLDFSVECRQPGASVNMARVVAKKFGLDGVLVNALPGGCSCTATARGGEGGPRALVLGDSFSLAVSPLFNQTFAATTYLHHRQTLSLARFKAAVEKHQPDVVVFLVVERLLTQALATRVKPAAPQPGEGP